MPNEKPTETPSEKPETTQTTEPVVTAESLIEEVSIDGMCGVY